MIRISWRFVLADTLRGGQTNSGNGKSKGNVRSTRRAKASNLELAARRTGLPAVSSDRSHANDH